MGIHFISKPLHVGKADSYSFTVSSQWLNGEEIIAFDAVSATTNLTVDSTTLVDNIIYMKLTGVSANFNSDIHINYSTATRSDCDYVTITVENC